MSEFLKKLQFWKKKDASEKPALSPTAAHLPEHGEIDENGRETILSLRNVDITFGKGDGAVRAVKNATFDIYKGETFSLVGESGSGKTTIGRAVIRVNPCAAGEILYKGVRISGKIPHTLDREVIRNVQMVFQDPAASLNERATVDYIVSEGLYNFKLFENEADRVNKVETMIKEVGLLPEHLTRYPHEFSGGQRQRIGLARAMIMHPEFVVADEPISALDVSIRAQVLNLLKKFQQEQNITYLFIAHDLSIVRFISDRIGVIYKGDIVEIADATELFDYPLHPYTRSLISAIPIPDPVLEKNKILFTYDPSVHEPFAEHYIKKPDGTLEPIELPVAEESAENETVEAKVKADVTTPPTDLVAGGSAVNPPESVDQAAQAEGEKIVADSSEKEEEKPVIIKEKPTLVDIGHNHFVFGYKKEIEEYKRIRESGEQVKSITIVDPNTEEGKKAKEQELERIAERNKKMERKGGSTGSILDTPLHDTGNIWYAILSFFLPLVGLILAIVFRNINYIHNYKVCKKWTIIAFAIIGAIVAIFLILLAIARI